MAVRLTLLGTGTPAPAAHRAGSGYLVEFDDEKLLFDCGPSVGHRLLEKGINPRELTAIFLTHLHYDHCVDYAYLVLCHWDQGAGKNQPLEIFGPEGIEEMNRLLFDAGGVFHRDLAARTLHPSSQYVFEMRGGQLPRKPPSPQVTELDEESVIERRGWKITAARAVHAEPQLITLAYRLECGGKVFVFAADSAPCNAITNLAAGADVLVHMCHFRNGANDEPRVTDYCSGHLDAAATAKDAGVKKLVAVHITEHIDSLEMLQTLKEEMAEVYSGEIIIGQDLLEI